MRGLPKITAYIPCYNAERYISQSINGLLNQSYPIDEILVIDDGSDDGSQEIASEFPVKVIRHEENRGLSAARNTAFRMAKNDYVASVDADCVPEEGWLETLVKAILPWPKAGGVGGKLMERWVETIPDKWRASILRHNWGDEKRFNPPWLSGSNTLLRKRAWEEVGGFWERLKRSGDDTNIWSRLKKKGYFPIYEPKAIVWHHRRDTIPSVLRAWWNWNNTPQREHFYRNLGKLVEKIELNFKIGSHNFKFHLAQEAHLLYVDFLLPFFATLLDIKNYISLRIRGRRGLSFSSEIELVRSLYTVVFNEMIYQLKRYGLPPYLIEKMESDLSSIELDEYEEAKKERELEDTDPQSAIKKFKEAIYLIVSEYLSKIQGSVDLIVISSRMK